MIHAKQTWQRHKTFPYWSRGTTTSLRLDFWEISRSGIIKGRNLNFAPKMPSGARSRIGSERLIISCAGMQNSVSCIATFELLHREKVPYIHFNDEAGLHGLNR
jgi:hypothetical protein